MHKCNNQVKWTQNRNSASRMIEMREYECKQGNSKWVKIQPNDKEREREERRDWFTDRTRSRTELWQSVSLVSFCGSKNCGEERRPLGGEGETSECNKETRREERRREKKRGETFTWFFFTRVHWFFETVVDGTMNLKDASDFTLTNSEEQFKPY